MPTLVQTQKQELRRHKRQHQAFFVKFQHVDETGRAQGAVLTGVTQDVAKGGMAIESKIRKEDIFLEIIPNKTRLKLAISIPADAVPVDSIAMVKWLSKVSEPDSDTYFFGVEYEKIGNAQQQMIERHIDRLRKKPKVFLYFFLLFTTLTVAFTYFILIAR
ncbi:MAG: PilZ domain-containing protein [Candidatus Omnitrophota bacterium]